MAKESKVRQSDVFDAANRLRSEGFNPTVRAVRGLVGGSTEIVSEYLKAWRQQYPVVDETAEVDPVTASIAELYDRLVEKATLELDAKLAEHDKELEEVAALLEAEAFVLDEARQKAENAEAEVRKKDLLVESLKSELDAATARNAELNSELRSQGVELAHQKEKAGDLAWSLKNEQERVKELERKVALQDETRAEQLRSQEAAYAERLDQLAELVKSLTGDKH